MPVGMHEPAIQAHNLLHYYHQSVHPQ
jgi:hypothetical protein